MEQVDRNKASKKMIVYNDMNERCRKTTLRVMLALSCLFLTFPSSDLSSSNKNGLLSDGILH